MKPRLDTSKKSVGRPLPSALAKNAAKLVARKDAELAARGREDLELIREKKLLIESAFFEMGEALARLKEPRVAEALGFKGGFAELVRHELGFDLTKANDLIAIATEVPRKLAVTWGQEKSHAVVQLVRATPALDSARSLARGGKVALSTGRAFDLHAATARETLEAAREERQAVAAKAKKPKRGVTTTREERALAKRLEAALHAAGSTRAKVVAVARAGREADLRIERVGVSELDAAERAIKSARKG